MNLIEGDSNHTELESKEIDANEKFKQPLQIWDYSAEAPVIQWVAAIGILLGEAAWEVAANWWYGTLSCFGLHRISRYRDYRQKKFNWRVKEIDLKSKQRSKNQILNAISDKKYQDLVKKESKNPSISHESNYLKNKLKEIRDSSDKIGTAWDKINNFLTQIKSDDLWSSMVRSNSSW